MRVLLAIVVILGALQQADPHRGTFTTGTNRPCASCHDKADPRADDVYRAAAAMSKMVTALNEKQLTSRIRRGALAMFLSAVGIGFVVLVINWLRQ